MAGETTIGGILGFLRLDASQFHREIEAAITEVEALQGADATVKVKADTSTANAKLAATEKQVDKLDKANARVAVSSRQAGGGVGALATAVITLGPAMVPLAAGAVGLTAAFGGLGSAGVLAIVGIRNEMKAGTALGLTYRASIDDLKESFNGLAQVAATNTLGPFQAAVGDLQHRTPELSKAIGEFATLAGSTGANLTGGLLSAFLALEPLMRDAGTYIQTLSQRFAAAMSGPGIVSFGDYVRSVFPIVMDALGSIVAAAGHLIAAFAPLGLGTLSMLRAFSDLISAIPVDILATVATTATSVFIGFKTWSALSGLVGGLGGAVVKLGASAAATATTMTVLNVAAGGIGIAIAALSFVMASNAETQRKAEAATNDYADALRVSNGVVDESVRALAAKRLLDSGAIDLARQVGASQATLTDIVLGTAGAQGLLKSQIDVARESMRATVNQQSASGAGYDDFNGKVAALERALGLEQGALANGVQKNKDLTAATEVTAGATDRAATATRNLANLYGVSVPTFQKVQDGQKGVAEQAAAATVKMQLENDAAGILKQTLDALNGESLDAAAAQNAFDSSLVNMGDHVDKYGKKWKFTTTNIHGMSAAAVALRGQLNGQVGNLQRVVEAHGGLANMTGKSRAEMVKMRQQIIDNAVAHGVDRAAVTSYIDEIFKIPKKVPPTKVEIDKAKAEADLKVFQDKINNLHGNTVVAGIRYVTSGTLPGGGRSTAGGQVKDAGPMPTSSPSGRTSERRMAGGGLITGPGTGTSDSILARISGSGEPLRVANGEFVSTDASRRRNRAALEAGNRGATLGVGSGGQGQTTITETTHAPVIIQNLYASDVNDIRRKADAAKWPESVKRRG